MPTLITWNIQWRPPASARAGVIARKIAAAAPSVVCLNEWRGGVLPGGGETITSRADYGYDAPAERRKVALWSAAGWRDVDDHGHDDLPGGRFVAGTTALDGRPVRVVGVCIPWRDAHVRTGRRDRAPWEDHLAYLRALRVVLGREARDAPLVVLGDWNQRLPRRRQPAHVHDALLRAFEGFTISTAGAGPTTTNGLIDHLAIRGDLAARSVRVWARIEGEMSLSDHDGVVVEVG